MITTPYSSSDSLDLEGFQAYLRVRHNKNNDTARDIIRDVTLYLRETDTAKPDLNKLLNLQQLESSMKEMKDEKGFKPTTMAEKLQRLRLAIKYMIRGKDDQVYHRGTRVIDAIDE